MEQYSDSSSGYVYPSWEFYTSKWYQHPLTKVDIPTEIETNEQISKISKVFDKHSK